MDSLSHWLHGSVLKYRLCTEREPPESAVCHRNRDDLFQILAERGYAKKEKKRVPLLLFRELVRNKVIPAFVL